MSVLKSLKGTFQNVQQDIVDGFRALTSLETTPRHDKVKQMRADGISLDCGADLLYRYQKEWSEMQNYTTDTAKKSEEVDGVVEEMFTKYETQWESACRLEEECAALPAFASTVSNMIQLIDSMQNDFKMLEEELEKLENLCEEAALVREQDSHLCQLAAYTKAKDAEAFSVKAKLWNILKDRAREMETQKSHAMKERQEAFMDAFTSDMEFYRKHGHTDKLPSVTEFPKVSSLSEITIEEDKKALDEFLGTGDGEHHEEGAFIEDDYTADYSASDDPLDDFPELNDNRPIDFDDTSKDISETNPGQNLDRNCPDDQKTEPSDSKLAEENAESRQGDENTEPNPDATKKIVSDSSDGKVNDDVSVTEETGDQRADVSADT